MRSFSVAKAGALVALLALTAVSAPALAQKKGAAGAAKEAPGAETQELNLAVGENKTIPAWDVKPYSEGTPCVVDIKLTSDAGAFVIACFSDPGLHALREQSRRRVFGIAECGVLSALTLGQRFGVIAILPTSIPRHLRYFGAMGVMDRFAADLPIGLGVAELSDKDRTLTRMVEVGRTLKDTHAADVLVMGCAGMARYRAALESAVGIPIVEPTQAAVAMAVGHVRLSQALAS